MYKFRDLDTDTVLQFIKEFQGCFDDLIQSGHIQIIKPVSFEQYQDIVRPRVTRAAEILLNTKRKRNRP